MVSPACLAMVVAGVNTFLNFEFEQGTFFPPTLTLSTDIWLL